jgi:glycosyltransferase involved in cell wall biosynthesis
MLMMQHASPPGSRRTYVVGCDVKEDIRVFSGSTYHLARQGVEDGLLTGMINLHPRGIRDWRIFARAGLWMLRGGIHKRRGFKFTDAYLDSVWKRALPTLQGSTVINNFQLFGPHFLESYRGFGIEPYFYIDGTLGENFAGYRAYELAQIDETVIRQALAAERDGYVNCRKVIVMSRRTAAYMVQRYDLPRDKIHIVPPGANIPERVLDGLDNQPRGWHRLAKRALTVGFIGLYPERKGLPTIADAVRLLRNAGYDARLHIIGKCPIEISQRDGVTHHGVIDKSIHMGRFLEVIRNIDIGCMLSRAELTGIALLEFLRMGIPVIATDVGGIPDIVELGAGQLVSPEISADDLAQRLARLIDEPDRIAELQEGAWCRRQNASWRRVVQELRTALDL